MDLKLALGFCKKWQVRAQTEDEAALHRFELPFCGVRLEVYPESVRGARQKCKAWLIYGPTRWFTATHLIRLKRDSLRSSRVFNLRNGWVLDLESLFYARKVLVTVDVNRLRDGIRRSGSCHTSFTDELSHNLPVIRAVHDTLAGRTCPEMLLDWLAQNLPNPAFDNALREIYG